MSVRARARTNLYPCRIGQFGTRCSMRAYSITETAAGVAPKSYLRVPCMSPGPHLYPASSATCLHRLRASGDGAEF
jgi:hypothetical protein